MNDAEIAWLAGLLEGEGTFRVRCSPALLASGRRPVLTVALAMCDKDVVERARSITGATMRLSHEAAPTDKPLWNDRWRLVWSGQQAEDLMHAVFPYMCQRRSAKIIECLATPNLSHRPKEAPND